MLALAAGAPRSWPSSSRPSKLIATCRGSSPGDRGPGGERTPRGTPGCCSPGRTCRSAPGRSLARCRAIPGCSRLRRTPLRCCGWRSQRRPRRDVDPPSQLRPRPGCVGGSQVRGSRWRRHERPRALQARYGRADAALVRGACRPGNALHPQRIYEPLATRCAPDHLGEAPLPCDRLVTQDVSKANHGRPGAVEQGLRAHAFDLSAPNRVRLAIAADSPARDHVPGNAEQRDQRQQRNADGTERSKPGVMQRRDQS